jgi:hypothetical protein
VTIGITFDDSYRPAAGRFIFDDLEVVFYRAGADSRASAKRH